MLLFASQTTPRLQHMAYWLGSYLFKVPLQIITDKQEIAPGEPVLNYSSQPLSNESFHLVPHPLLSENAIRPQTIEVEWADHSPYFFKTTGGDFHFDVLAASFYLLQRYEEYLPHQKDRYGRYDAANSIAFNHGFLHLPVVDIWMQQLKKALLQKFPQLQFTERAFQFIPTYDVDIAFAYRGKGVFRNLWALYRNLTTGQLNKVVSQASWILNGTADPFDVFDELEALHQLHNLQPVFFLLLARRQRGIDKNINPNKKSYRQLIQKLAAQYRTGIHFSGAASATFSEMKVEKSILETITGRPTSRNRIHYLLTQLTETYRQLLRLGITEDYTMGYGVTNGFRASTCTPYCWYDLAAEKSTHLRIFPFCYMDAVTLFEEESSEAGALQEMMRLLLAVQQVQGCFISIFHNHFMGQDAKGRQWMEMYKTFLEGAAH